jgi:hypothetical protein
LWRHRVGPIELVAESVHVLLKECLGTQRLSSEQFVICDTTKVVTDLISITPLKASVDERSKQDEIHRVSATARLTSALGIKLQQWPV